MEVWPRYPAVPLSINGTLAIKHIELTYRLAAKLSKAFMTISKPLKKEMGKSLVSVMSAKWAVISAEGFILRAASRAITAFDWPICLRLNKNWRFKLLSSIVSKSTRWMLRKLDRTAVLSSSQPIPPVPTINTLASSILVIITGIQMKTVALTVLISVMFIHFVILIIAKNSFYLVFICWFPVNSGPKWHLPKKAIFVCLPLPLKVKKEFPFINARMTGDPPAKQTNKTSGFQAHNTVLSCLYCIPEREKAKNLKQKKLTC